ncbi:MAG: RNA polymerase sigma factor [Hyphomonadaceae bacterium]
MKPSALAERVARESYGRLLALLAARTRDVAAAEDALAEAFAAALTAWPRIGAPDNPEAWLFAAAKRKLIDAARRARTAAAGEAEILRGIAEMEAEMAADGAPDRRLGLMFACAHPAIEESVRTPLMLQAVLGFSAERIASAFLVEPGAMGQRLVRAKKKIKESGASFDVPEPSAWGERFGAVLQAIYAAYGAGWSDPLGADPERRGLAEEAIWLGRVLVQQLPDEPEVLGMLALMLHLEARRPARRDANGEYVPLDQQDVTLWRRDLIDEAERTLRKASAAQRPGRFQLEAAVQSAHAARVWRGDADWHAIVLLYEALSMLTGSPVARLNAAAALARRDGPEAGLAAAEHAAAAQPELRSYQPYWALIADLCAKLGRAEAAHAAYAEAIARERDPAIIRFLSARRAAL